MSSDLVDGSLLLECFRGPNYGCGRGKALDHAGILETLESTLHSLCEEPGLTRCPVETFLKSVGKKTFSVFFNAPSTN